MDWFVTECGHHILPVGVAGIMHKNTLFRLSHKIKKNMTGDPDLVGTDWVKSDPRPKETCPLGWVHLSVSYK